MRVPGGASSRMKSFNVTISSTSMDIVTNAGFPVEKPQGAWSANGCFSRIVDTPVHPWFNSGFRCGESRVLFVSFAVVASQRKFALRVGRLASVLTYPIQFSTEYQGTTAKYDTKHMPNVHINGGSSGRPIALACTYLKQIEAKRRRCLHSGESRSSVNTDRSQGGKRGRYNVTGGT